MTIDIDPIDDAPGNPDFEDAKAKIISLEELSLLLPETSHNAAARAELFNLAKARLKVMADAQKIMTYEDTNHKGVLYNAGTVQTVLYQSCAELILRPALPYDMNAGYQNGLHDIIKAIALCDDQRCHCSPCNCPTDAPGSTTTPHIGKQKPPSCPCP